ALGANRDESCVKFQSIVHTCSAAKTAASVPTSLQHRTSHVARVIRSALIVISSESLPVRAPFNPGALYVRRAALIEAQADSIWNAFESEDRMRTWFGHGHTLDRYEPQLGGAVELSVTLDDGVHRFGGAITHFEPGHRLTFSDNWLDHLAWPEPTFISFVLHAQSGATLVELYHHGFEVLGDIASKECLAYEQGWDAKHLQYLKSLIESG
ncbi:MAG: SRPBCC domain-containing protein, partial [Gammaproteobacteria bacterium]|nr:SRPBCC domain-containing protein [Gammaproteobacteria bacterium]